MSVETEPAATETTDIERLAGELGEAISRSEEYERYEAAQERVKGSESAQEKIEEFESLRQEFVLARQTGEATQEDLKRLQAAQQELHEIPVMAEYLDAQARLDAKLEALNDAVSEPLSVDFGEQAGGCCQD
ncbi:MAG: YlbF family regulator [Halalkalicoccus sp.]